MALSVCPDMPPTAGVNHGRPVVMNPNSDPFKFGFVCADAGWSALVHALTCRGTKIR